MMTIWATTAALFLGIAAVAHASAVASSEYPCTFSTTWQGKTVTWDLSGLHNASADYIGYDNSDHTYAFQVCGGLALQTCNPQHWSASYLHGFAIQLWGGEPTKAGYTRDCDVLAIPPIVKASVLEVNGKSWGVTLQYHGATVNTTNNPFWCPYNPVTKQMYKRTLTMNIACAPSQTEPLANIVAIQNLTNDCSYMINATSPLVCNAVDCYHGSMQAGKCVCDEYWAGPKCDQFAGSCAVGSSCNVCRQCCAGYSSSTCQTCIANECKPPVCSATSSCTTCRECCVGWLPSQQACDKCVAANCS